MRFQFRLEKMLSFIRIKETTKKLEVAVCVQKLEFLKRKKTELEKTIQLALEKSFSGNFLNMDWLTFVTDKIVIDKLEREKILKLIQEEDIVLKKKQVELSRLAMRRKGLESLKEKKRAEFKIQESRKEQKILDENYEILRMRKI